MKAARTILYILAGIIIVFFFPVYIRSFQPRWKHELVMGWNYRLAGWFPMYFLGHTVGG